MKNKMPSIIKSVLWCFVILLFPIISGTLAVIFSLTAVETLFLQGAFMAMSLIPPAILVFCKKWHWDDIGFKKFHFTRCKRFFYFLPLLVILIPAAVKGFYMESGGYVFGCLFLYSFVGLSEEVYFRGIIPRYLKEEFSNKGILVVSTLIFAVGHIATALTGSNVFEISLTVLNALIFGWLAIEMTMIASNIMPSAFLHFLLDFETKIVVLNGNELLLAEGVRGALMFIFAICLAVAIKKDVP